MITAELEERLFEPNARRTWKVGAFDSNVEEPWILNSRKISPVYVDCSKFQNYSGEWFRATNDISEYVSKLNDVDTTHKISGGELRDLPFSIPVSFILGLPHVIIRKESKGYGIKDRIVGRIEQGERVLHVADLRTSGKSELSWIKAIRGAGGQVDFSISYFDRLEGGTAKLQEVGVQGISLVQMTEDFFQIGMNGEHLTSAGYEQIRMYLDNSEEWALNFLRENPSYIKQHLTQSVADGKLKNMAPVEVLTIGYPQLKGDFAPQVRDWLAELGVTHSVPEIGYEPK